MKARGAGRGGGAARPGARHGNTARAKRPDWLLLGIVALALALRLWGIHDRLPDASLGVHVLDDSAVEETDRTTVGRAWAMWRGGAQAFDPNPHTGGWPALSFYFTLALQFLFKLYASLSSGASSAAQLQAHIVGTESASFFLFARIVGALIGTLTVFLTYRLGSASLGRGVGFLAALLLATNPLHALTSQHVSDPNLLALLFVLLAAGALLRVAAQPTLRDSILAGAWIGLAGACKYVPLVLGIPLALAHRGFGAGEARARDEGAFLARPALWAGLGAIVAALFLGSPFLFIDWRQTLVDVTGQRRALFSDWVGQTSFPISLPAYLGVTLPHAMGWPAYLAALMGLALLWRMGGAARLLAMIPALVVLANGMLMVAQERYVLPAIPFLHLAAALSIIRLTQGLVARRSTVLAPALAVLAVAWPFPELVATRHSLALPDSRHVSRRWIQEHLDPKARMAVELYGPVFDDAERAVVIWPFFATHAQAASPAYHPEFLDGFDYHVASEEISRRFEAAPRAYPVENAFYRWLRGHAPVVWESDIKTTSGPHIVIRRLPRDISSLEQRDSLFAAAMPKPSQLDRIELWCVDCARLFTRYSDFQRTEEWARRGLRVGVPSMEPQLRGALAIALWFQGHLDAADAEIRIAIARKPRESDLRTYHGSILIELGRHAEALEELRESLRLDPDQQGAEALREQIARLEAATSGSR